MAQNRRHFDKFAGQTRLKHYILKSYVETWALVLLQGGHYANAWFIDAFAGAGKDDSGTPGSPVIACRVAADVRAALSGKERRSTTPELRIIAIEADTSTFRKLEAATREFADARSGGCLELVHGTLADKMDWVMALGSADEPKLFFLDPFGVRGLDAAVVRRIFTRSRYEALILFSDTGAIRLHGAAEAAKRPVATKDVLPSLFDSLTEHAPAQEHLLAEPAAQAEHTAEDLDSDMREPPATEAILRTAFGDQFEVARASVAGARSARVAWMKAYVSALRAWGATHVLSFSVMDERDEHKYYLIHAATNGLATKKLKEAIYTAMRRRASEPGVQTNMLYVTSVDTSEMVEALHRHFAGRTVRWQNGNEPDTVREYLLRETSALNSDLPAIQQALDAAGWRGEGRAARYAFPV